MEVHELIRRRLREHLQEIRGLTDGLPTAQLRKQPGEGRWSLHEIVMHLVETQDIFTERIARMLSDDLPQITPYTPDAARSGGSYLLLDFNDGMTGFTRQREHLLNLLGSLRKDQWDREGVHPEIRHYSVERCAEALMRHEEHHLYSMFNIFFGIPE
jgi:hypothetical protein